jgi:hypothetical protein
VIFFASGESPGRICDGGAACDTSTCEVYDPQEFFLDDTGDGPAPSGEPQGIASWASVEDWGPVPSQEPVL